MRTLRKRFWLTLEILALLWLFSCKNALPRIKVKDLSGAELYLSSLKGKPVILYVWSRTCVGHERHLKELQRIAIERKDLYVVSYAVAMEVKDVQNSYKEMGIKNPSFITLVDTPVRLNEFYTIEFLPSTFVFDSSGKLIGVKPGLSPPPRRGGFL
ncbi:MAG: TlpA family protein disulfide reductase [Aquificaceae bacterium]|nr:TlpA family protein disulfide reductase [Aquificaceae bacterium]MDW8237511.1 TlpA disulfide reductase family protein [Aquificaceae bacterium]